MSIAAVLGGCGFIGSALVRRLLSMDYERVFVVDDLSFGSRDLLPFDERLAFIHEDVADVRLDRIGRPASVYYLCASPYVPASFADPGETMRVNVDILRAFLQGNMDSLPFRFVYASSGEVYGNVVKSCANERQILTERDSALQSPYAQSRVLAERILRENLQTASISVVSLRLFNVIGPRATHPYFVPEMIRQVSSGEVAHGNLDTIRDFVSIDDTVDAFIAAGEATSAGLREVNVASGIGVRMRDILSWIIKRMGSQHVRLHQVEERIRPAELVRLVGCNEKAHRLFGWSTRTSLHDAIDSTIEWYRKAGRWPYEQRA